MKEFYHNKIGFNTAVITCKKENFKFDLHYHLYDNPVQHIWQGLHLNNSGIRTSNYSSMSVSKLTSELQHCCSIAGVTDVPETFDQNSLNKLHNKFVASEFKDDTWARINDLIHILESKIDNPFNDYYSTITFYSNNETYIPLKEEHKIFLNTDIVWGRMNLGYGTLGKDWVDISKNDDNLDDFALQTTISSETTLMFCVEPGFPLHEEVRFYNWASNKNNVPLNNLNKLALGRYSLGQIIITDTLLNFHNNISDWYVPNHRCKLQWNKEVFDSSIEIVEIKFKNTDMLYESYMQHGNLIGFLNV